MKRNYDGPGVSIATVAKNKMMMAIPFAGRIGKGSNEGCIYCHRSASGGDYIFYPDIKITP